LRPAVSLAFTPSAIERLRQRVQQLVDEILDRAAERGSIELVDELAVSGAVPGDQRSARPADRSQ
jgi:cytochrome P450